jgi:hypothetical protein
MSTRNVIKGMVSIYGNCSVAKEFAFYEVCHETMNCDH